MKKSSELTDKKKIITLAKSRSKNQVLIQNVILANELLSISEII